MTRRTLRILVTITAAWLAAAGLAAQTEPLSFTVVAPVAGMHSAPSADADIVSQAIFGSGVVLLESADGWAKVRTADDYEGWIALGDLVRASAPYAREGRVATVWSLFAALYREPDIENHAPVITVPFESRLEITGEADTVDGRFHSVRLPGGATAWVQGGDVAFDPAPLSIDAALRLAQRFIGLPYRWGGTSAFGFDCSGFTQMLMRRRGVTMPRDTRPQARWDGMEVVERSELRPGDLLFFGKVPAKINHTGMYIGNGEFIHATRRSRPAVQFGCLDEEPWTSQFITARRAQ